MEIVASSDYIQFSRGRSIQHVIEPESIYSNFCERLFDKQIYGDIDDKYKPTRECSDVDAQNNTNELENDKVLWTVEGETTDFNYRLSYDSVDSGFSSDDNIQTNLDDRTKLIRSKSLRSALRNSSLSSSQKSVRFADSLGLDLVQKSFYDLEDAVDTVSGQQIFDNSRGSFKNEAKIFKRSVTFQEINIPIRTGAELSHITRTNCVCLQSVAIMETNVIGIINVLNLAMQKQVNIVYTFDYWKTQVSTSGVYSKPVGIDGAVDAFNFIIAFPANLPVGIICEFCIEYIVNGSSYWDNNNNANYILKSIVDDLITNELVLLCPSLPNPKPIFPEFRQENKVQNVDKETNENVEQPKRIGFKKPDFDYLPELPDERRPKIKLTGWRRKSQNQETDYYATL